MNNSICNNVETPANTANTNVTSREAYEAVSDKTTVVPTTTLTDTRDSKTYTIRKLADGKCWMTQNLRLIGSRTLTSNDSNVSSNFTLSASNSGTWCVGDNSTCDDQSMVLDSGNDNYGAYYNWYSATAGTGTYGLLSGDASSSICPKGWVLPSGGSDSNADFQKLYTVYDSDASLMQNSNLANFVRSGYRFANFTSSAGSSGNYWSRTAKDSNYAYFLYLGSSSVIPGNEYNKFNGSTVRCLTP